MIKYSLHNYHLTNQQNRLNNNKIHKLLNYNINNFMKQTITSCNLINCKAQIKRIFYCKILKLLTINHLVIL